MRKKPRHTRRHRFSTLVDIPDHWPVSFLVRYGDSDFIKGVHCLFDSKPLREYGQHIRQAIRERWDAQKSGLSDSGVEQGGPMFNEPGLELETKLPRKYIKWTNDLRLLYHSDEGRKKTR